MKRHAPAADRNKGPILDVLRTLVHDGALVLEIASGTGQHVAHFAAHLPRVTFQPTDVDPDALTSVSAHIAEANLTNVRPPAVLDTRSTQWPLVHADRIVCCNMIHIAPWAACEGLFQGAARSLPAGGVMLTYGPYRFSGAFTAPSNADFDASLRARDPAWGVRDVDDLDALGEQMGLSREATVAMPANNHCLIWRKAGA